MRQIVAALGVVTLVLAVTACGTGGRESEVSAEAVGAATAEAARDSSADQAVSASGGAGVWAMAAHAPPSAAPTANNRPRNQIGRTRLLMAGLRILTRDCSIDSSVRYRSLPLLCPQAGRANGWN